MNATALTIAGSDPSGGAGIQADLKTFHQHGAYGMSVLTLLTAQNTCAVEDVLCLAPAFVLAQLDAVLRDIPPRAIKTGALGNRAIIEAIASRAADFPCRLVVDPVMISKHGAPLLDPAAADALRSLLLPHAFLVTPNLHEAEALVGFPVTDRAGMERAAELIADMGARNVLLKGGHLDGRAADLLWQKGTTLFIEADRVDTPHTHGTGCVLSAAITARLARGESLHRAVTGAKAFICEAIRTNPGLGAGHGPVNMHAPVPRATGPG